MKNNAIKFLSLTRLNTSFVLIIKQIATAFKKKLNFEKNYKPKVFVSIYLLSQPLENEFNKKSKPIMFTAPNSSTDFLQK